MGPLITVIVPVYKVEPYLHQCVDSVLNQTYSNVEVILVDDGSPDNCGVICDEYAARDNRVRVIHKPNGGLSDARNAGMAQMQGEFLAFVDSDDMLPETAIEALALAARDTGADLVIGEHNRFEDEPVLHAATLQADVRCMSVEEAMTDMLLNGCAAWARLYRSELHRGILFPVGEINEDEAIILQLLDRCRCIAKTDALVYHYRCRPESITTAAFSPKRVDWYKHCVQNLIWIQEKVPQLLPYAYDRLGSCIVFLLHEMAVSQYEDAALEKELLGALRKDYRLYQKHCLSGKKEKIRMWIMRFLPFGLYRLLFG